MVNGTVTRAHTCRRIEILHNEGGTVKYKNRLVVMEIRAKRKKYGISCRNRIEQLNSVESSAGTVPVL